MENKNIEKLWEYACCGDIKELKKYYNSKNSEVNIRYNKFGNENSLIMGAYRNDEFETVEYLLSVGETITEKERNEISTYLKRKEIMKKILES